MPEYFYNPKLFSSVLINFMIHRDVQLIKLFTYYIEHFPRYFLLKFKLHALTSDSDEDHRSTDGAKTEHLPRIHPVVGRESDRTNTHATASPDAQFYFALNCVLDVNLFFVEKFLKPN